MTQESEKIVEILKNMEGVNYLIESFGGRHFVEVEVDLIEVHPDFNQIRGKDPSDLSLLQSSMKETGGPVYTLCIYAELDGDSVKLFVVDGHQRLRSAKANGDKVVLCQYFSSWDSVETAMADALSLQWARYEAKEADIVSLIRCGKITQAEIARKTGYNESKISRLAKVAGEERSWLYDAIAKGIITLAKACKLIDACNDNREKEIALKNTHMKKYAEFEEQRKYWDNRIKSQKRDWPKKVKAKAKIATYYKNFDWEALSDALDADEGIVKTSEGNFLDLDEKVGKKKSGVSIGDSNDWKEDFAVYGFFEKKITDVDPKDIDYMLQNWDVLRDMLVAIRNEKELPSINPIVMSKTPAEPDRQTPNMTVAGSEPEGA